MAKLKIVVAHKPNFETLKDAIRRDRVAMMDCVLRSSGEHVAVVCAMNDLENGDTGMVPLCMFFNDNPYEMLISPNDPEFENYPDLDVEALVLQTEDEIIEVREVRDEE